MEWTLQPATGVTQVYEALTGNDAEHFLGGGANFIYTDLRHRVLLNKAHFTGAAPAAHVQQERHAEPVLPQLARVRGVPGHHAIGRLAFPNAVDDPPHCSTARRRARCSSASRDRTQLCFKTDRLDYEVYAGSPAR